MRVWDLATGHQQAKLTGHDRRVYSVAVTADGTTAVSAIPASTAKIENSRMRRSALAMATRWAAPNNAIAAALTRRPIRPGRPPPSVLMWVSPAAIKADEGRQRQPGRARVTGRWPRGVGDSETDDDQPAERHSHVARVGDLRKDMVGAAGYSRTHRRPAQRASRSA